MTEVTFEYELGEHADRTYFLTARASPGFHDPSSFAVVVHYNDPATDEEVQVARIDTAHGSTHFDWLYRRDEPKDDIDADFWEAVDYLEADWRTYARGHERANR